MGEGAKRVRAGPEGSNSRVECPLARFFAVVEKLLDEKREVVEMGEALESAFLYAPEVIEK